MSNITLGTIEQRRAEVADMRRRIRIFNSIDMSKNGKDLELEYELWEIGQVGYWFCWFFVFVSWSMIVYSHNEELVRWGRDLEKLHSCNTTSERGMYNDNTTCLTDGDRYKLDMIQLIAKLSGAFISGLFADLFGRLLIFRILLGFHTIASIILIFTTTPENGFFCRFVIIFTAKGMALTCFVLLMDYCSRQTRCVCGLLFYAFKGLGYIILGWAMINCTNWRCREVIWLCSTQGFLIFSAYFLPESARLYSAYGQSRHTWRIVRSINKLGHRTDLNEGDLHKSFKKQLSSSVGSSFETFKSYEFMSRLFFLSIPGFLINDLLLKANEDDMRSRICQEYAFFTLFMGAIEIISYVIAIPFFITFGRKFTIVMLHIAASVLYLLVYFIHSILTKIILMILGRLMVKAARAGIQIMIAETFPTNCRGATLGIVVLVDELGTLIYRLADLKFCMDELGFMSGEHGLTFIFNVIAAVSIVFVPSTRHRIIVDTFPEATNLAFRQNEHVGVRSVARCFK